MHAKAPALRSKALRRPERRHSQAAQAMGSRTSRRAQGRSNVMAVSRVDRRKRLSHFGARLAFLWGRRFRLPTCWRKRSSRHLRGNARFARDGGARGAGKGEPGPEIEGAIQRGKEARNAAVGIGGRRPAGIAELREREGVDVFGIAGEHAGGAGSAREEFKRAVVEGKGERGSVFGGDLHGGRRQVLIERKFDRAGGSGGPLGGAGELPRKHAPAV